MPERFNEEQAPVTGVVRSPVHGDGPFQHGREAHMHGPRLPARYTLTLSLLAFGQRFDDRYGAGKDGAEKWAEYQARVRYRIVPSLY